MINLPKWALTLCPPLYDTSSLSPIEQTAQVYSKMRELIENYNKFVDEVSSAIDKLEVDTHTDIKEFKCVITELVQKYIETIDMKMSEQDLRIEKTIDEKVVIAVSEKINDVVAYDSENEEVYIGV